MNKLLGDRIAEVTTALGIPPCDGCEKRKAALNAWSRRGFIGTIATAVAAWQIPKVAAGTASDHDAIRVLRFLNTALGWHGLYIPLPDLMGTDAVVRLKDSPAAEKNGIGNNFMSSLNIEGREILPGWQLQYTTDGKGYSASIKSNDGNFTFTTDEKGIIAVHTVLSTNFFSKLSQAVQPLFRCLGPIGEPGCCCAYVCCDQCNCCRGPGGGCFNCGCLCCVWCEPGC